MLPFNFLWILKSYRCLNQIQCIFSLICKTLRYQSAGKKKKGRTGAVLCSVTHSCPTLCDPMVFSLADSSVHEIWQARILEWVACHFLLQGMYPDQGQNLSLLHWQTDSLPLTHLESPSEHQNTLIDQFSLCTILSSLLMNSLLWESVHPGRNNDDSCGYTY